MSGQTVIISALFFASVVLATVHGAEVITLNRLNVAGDAENMRGWIHATITLSNKTQLNGSVCGKVDAAAYYITCWSTGWLAVIERGTVGSLSIAPPDALPIIGNLKCSGKSSRPCTFNLDVAACIKDSKNIAALSCFWTPAQVAGVAAGGLAFCILCLLIPCICCCCCFCCPKSKTGEYKTL